MENCSSLEPWMFRPTFDEPRWIADAFARDNDALTRALQISLSDSSSTSSAAAAAALSSPDAAAASLLFHHLIKPEPSSAYDPAVSSKRGRGPSASPSGKITKRKSRASKRSPTTYIAADPANFRQMVQQVTGIRLSGDYAAEIPADQILRQEPHRRAAAAAVEGYLPTLDTSAFLFDRVSDAGPGPVGPAPVELDVYNFGSFPSFPTLESWSAM